MLLKLSSENKFIKIKIKKNGFVNRYTFIILEFTKNREKWGKSVKTDKKHIDLVVLICSITLADSLNYRNRKRLKETKRLKINKLVRHKMNENKKLNNYNAKLALLNSKSVNFKTFSNFFMLKHKIRNFIKNKMENLNEYLQKQKWFGYINTKRHESVLLNNIEKMYGKDTIMLAGDWSNKGKLKYISTPNMGLKRLLKQRFETYLIDEYGTSKYDYITGAENKKLIVKLTEQQKKGLSKKINELTELKNPKEKESNKLIKLKETLNRNTQELYSVFTCKWSKENVGCISRDKKSVLCMFHILQSLLETGKRPKLYRRTTKPLLGSS